MIDEENNALNRFLISLLKAEISTIQVNDKILGLSDHNLKTK